MDSWIYVGGGLLFPTTTTQGYQTTSLLPTGDCKHGGKQKEIPKYAFSTSSFPLVSTELPCCSGVHKKKEIQKEQGVEISLFWGAKLMKNQSGLKNPLAAIMH